MSAMCLRYDWCWQASRHVLQRPSIMSVAQSSRLGVATRNVNATVDLLKGDVGWELSACETIGAESLADDHFDLASSLPFIEDVHLGPPLPPAKRPSQPRTTCQFWCTIGPISGLLQTPAAMPYNNTPITPSAEVTGTVSLPLARVKKIIATDTDIASCSNNAAFVMTVATEMFLQHLVEQSHNIAKSEKKPRRNIQYRDVANAVARVENLEFLSDVVPKTQTMRSVRQKQAAGGRDALGGNIGAGQRTLDGKVIGAAEAEARMDDDAEPQAVNGARQGDDGDKMDVDGDDADEDMSMHTANEEQPAMPIDKLVSP